MKINLKIIFEKAAVLAATLILCLVILEIGLRISGRSASNTYRGEYVQYRDFYRFKKNLVKVNDWSTYSYTTITNSIGARDSETGDVDINKKPYIVFLGASQVFGQGVDFDESFVGIFSDYAAGKGIEVLNFAVGGHFLMEQETILREFIEDERRKPELVILGLSSSSLNWYDTTHSTLEPVMVKSGYLFYKSSWKKAYIRLIIKNTLSIYDFLRDVFWKLNARLNLIEISERLPKHFELYSEESRLYNLDEAGEAEGYLNKFEEYCAGKGIKTAYLFVPLVDSFRLKSVLGDLGADPSRYHPSLYEEFMIDYARKNGKLLLNPRPVLKKHYDLGEKLCFERDPHYNEFANRLVGEYLIEEVFLKHGLF